MAEYHPRLVRAADCSEPQDRNTTAISVLGRPATPLSAAFVLVSSERRRLSRDGKSTGREAQHVLARLYSHCSGWCLCRYRARCAAPCACRDREWIRDK